MRFQVLVVDDAETNRAVMSDLLTQEGYTVEVAESGADALRLMRQRPPDLVLLDVMMPGVSGIEVCREIRSTPELAEIFVILVTALADRESRLKGFDAGADDYLTKPIDRAELRLRLRTMARLHRYRSLLQERTRTAMVTDLSPDAILTCGVDGRVLSSNPAARVAFPGLARGEVLLLADVIEPTDADDRAWIVSAEGTVSGKPKLIRARGGRGTRVWEMSRTWHVINDDDVAIVIAHDVTELERLRASTARLHRHEAIGRAAAGIAHDLRNVLTGLRMALGLLTAQLPRDVNAALVAADEIDSQIDLGVELTRKITSAARGEVVSPGASGPISLNDVIREMTPLLRHWAGELADLSIDLGDCPRVWMDRESLFQLISNLVVNAGQAIAADGRVILRTYAGENDGAHAVLEVVDNGCGMDAATQERIFDHYFSTKSAQGGTGLGLATVYEISSKYGCAIDVESLVGRGTTFRVRWPKGPQEGPCAVSA